MFSSLGLTLSVLNLIPGILILTQDYSKDNSLTKAMFSALVSRTQCGHMNWICYEVPNSAARKALGGRSLGLASCCRFPITTIILGHQRSLKHKYKYMSTCVPQVMHHIHTAHEFRRSESSEALSGAHSGEPPARLGHGVERSRLGGQCAGPR